MATKDKSLEEKVVEAASEQDDNLIRFANGVVLRAKAAPPLSLIRVMAKFKRPEPPTYFNEKLGRWLENPMDPDYLERVQAQKTESASAMLNALILLGTEAESVPKSFPKHTSDDWIAELQELGIEVNKENERSRYLNWVVFKAATAASDMQEIQRVVGRLSGVPESAVKSAEDFPGRKQAV